MKQINFSSASSRIGALVWSCLWVAVWTSVGATAATASCGDRPGTPDSVKAQAASASRIMVSWRNTTGKHAPLGLRLESAPIIGVVPASEHIIYFDMYFRDGAMRPIGRDLTGTGVGRVSYHSVSSKSFDGLAPNTRYCFALRARTHAGTQGCISAQTSNWACATTLRR